MFWLTVTTPLQLNYNISLLTFINIIYTKILFKLYEPTKSSYNVFSKYALQFESLLIVLRQLNSFLLRPQSMRGNL